MNSITINGKSFLTAGKNISVVNDSIMVDGVLITSELKGNVTVIFTGDLAGLDCTSAVVNGNINGDVDCTSLIVTGNVKGDVDCTSLKCNDIEGDVDCTSLNCNEIKGKVTK